MTRCIGSGMRYFNGLLFLGSDRTPGHVRLLRSRFEDAVKLSGVLQQPDHPEDEEQAEAMKAARATDEVTLEEAVLDLATALLGRQVTLGGHLPYPWDTKALDEATMVPDDIAKLIRWRERMTDRYGEDAVYFITSVLSRWRPGRAPEVPGELRGAMDEFQSLDDDTQLEYVYRVLG